MANTIPKSNLRQAYDLSTGHITEKDNRCLWVAQVFGEELPMRVVEFKYGFYITITQDLDEFLASGKENLLGHGLSEAFVDLLEKAARNGINLVILDRDGDFDPELPTFEW